MKSHLFLLDGMTPIFIQIEPALSHLGVGESVVGVCVVGVCVGTRVGVCEGSGVIGCAVGRRVGEWVGGVGAFVGR